MGRRDHDRGAEPGRVPRAPWTAWGGRGRVLTVVVAVSGTWNAARLAADSTDVPLSVIDSETAAGAQALVVLAAAQPPRRGPTAPGGGGGASSDRRGPPRRRRGRVGLPRAQRSGAWGSRAGRAGCSGLQPLFEFRHGAPAAPSGDEPRGRAGRGSWATGGAAASGGAGDRLHVAGLHAAAEADAAGCSSASATSSLRWSRRRSWSLEFSAVMVAHTGPGLVGLAWWWQPTVVNSELSQSWSVAEHGPAGATAAGAIVPRTASTIAGPPPDRNRGPCPRRHRAGAGRRADRTAAAPRRGG